MNKFLTSCLVVFILGDISQKYYSDGIDFLALTDEQALIDWSLKMLRDLGIWLFVGVSIVWSIWSYKAAQNKLKAKWYIAFSISLGLAFVIGTGYFYSKYSNAIEHRASVIIHDNPKIIKGFSEYLESSVHSVQEKHDNSQLHGSIVFKESGNRIQVLDAQGNKVIYQPTDEDIELRKKAEMLKVIERHTKNSLKMATYTWCVILFTSLFIGLVAIGGRNAYNKQLKRTP